MQPVARDKVVWSVGLSVCLSGSWMSPIKMAELIEMPFGMWTGVAQEPCTKWGAYRRHLMNTIEPSSAAAMLNY